DPAHQRVGDTVALDDEEADALACLPDSVGDELRAGGIAGPVWCDVDDGNGGPGHDGFLSGAENYTTTRTRREIACLQGRDGGYSPHHAPSPHCTPWRGRNGTLDDQRQDQRGERRSQHAPVVGHP